MAVSRIGEFVGRVLGDRYRLLAPLGTGGSAHVFLAEDVRLRRRVAVKVLHAALADDEAFLKRFRAEAQAAAGLNHPHIMRVFDWGEDGGGDLSGPFLVLEYLGGGSLRDLLDRGHRLTPSQALLVGLEAAKGLDHAHRRGLVHRDIKPANLLFDDEGRLCVADFGVARALAEAAWTEPTGAVIGTARYASPEQAKGGSVDGRADVYALALVLVEIVTGQVPFAADTTIATLMGRAETPLVAPPALGALADAVNAAGAIDPAERVDAAGFVKALDRAARELDAPEPLPLAPARPETEITAVIDRDPTEIAPVVLAETARAAAPATRRRRRRWPWALLAAALIALAAAGGVYAKDNILVASHAVPVLAGKSLSEARTIAARRHFKVHVQDRVNRNDTKVDDVLSQNPPSTATLKENRTIEVVVSLGPFPVLVPDLTNVDADEASRRLAAAGFTVGHVTYPYDEVVAKGIVLDWQGKGGELPKGTSVDLTVSNGPHPVTLSDWKGKPFADAEAAMKSVGFKVQRKDVYSDTYPQPGTVVGTSPGPGDVERGATIVVSVSQGPETVEVPNVVGMNLDNATRRLESAGFVVEVNGRAKGRVVGQDPAGGTKAKRGSLVAIALL
ncbi:MAG TPA: PASTA domain-containing protein [Acidimicrobiales bacterium]|nr:PASTA domain-containing protein [Acidimicrobiales bacterium]